MRAAQLTCVIRKGKTEFEVMVRREIINSMLQISGPFFAAVYTSDCFLYVNFSCSDTAPVQRVQVQASFKL